MTDSPDNSRLSRTFADKWQGPLLLVSIVLCALAGWRLWATRPKLTWDDSYQHVVALTDQAAAGDYTEADEAAKQLIAETPDDRHDLLAKAYCLRADIRYRSILESNDRSSEQLGALVDFYRTALGEDSSLLTAEIAERMGAAFADVGRHADAVTWYRRAFDLDPARAAVLKQRIVDLRRKYEGVTGLALQSMLDDYLATAGLSPDQKQWAIEQKVDLLIADGQAKQAEKLIDDQIVLCGDPAFVRRLVCERARVLIEQGRTVEAEDSLTDLLDQLERGGDLFARASLLRGNVTWQDRPRDAERDFAAVLQLAPRTNMATAARVGLARAFEQMGEFDRSLEEYLAAAGELAARSKDPLVGLDEIQRDLDRVRAEQMKIDPQVALRFAQANYDVVNLQPSGPTLVDNLAVLGRLAAADLAVANQLQAQLRAARGPLSDEKRLRALDERIKKHFTEAGQAMLKRAKLAEPVDDNLHGDSLWGAALAFDESGKQAQAIDALELFRTGRPSDSRMPEALFRLGRAYQATGQWDKAIDVFQENIDRDLSSDRHLKALTGQIPMVKCYIAKGPDFYDQAEQILRGIIDDDDIVTPDTELYRDALFELGKLLYEQHEWRAAIDVLGEAIKRSPGALLPDSEPRAKELREQYFRATRGQFLMAECYSRAAAKSLEAAATQTNLMVRGKLIRSHSDQLVQAELIFKSVIERLEAFTGKLDPQTAALDEEYRRNSYFARGDCMYRLNRFENAIKLYEQAVFLFQQHPSAIGGYLQISNCQDRLGRPDKARAALAQARVLLDEMDPSRLSDAGLKQQMQDWKRYLDSVQRVEPIVRKGQP